MEQILGIADRSLSRWKNRVCQSTLADIVLHCGTEGMTKREKAAFQDL